MLSSLLFGLILGSAMIASAEDLLVFEDVAPTVYYDNLWREDGDPCAKPNWGSGWSDTQLAESLCESEHPSPKRMSQYKNNQIVAIDRRYFEGKDAQAKENRKKFCGKQVRVWDPSGKEYISAGGDMFIWDGCLECKELGGHKVDFSGPDFLAMTGQGPAQCGVGLNKFRVVVTDKQVIEPDAQPSDNLGGVGTMSSLSSGQSYASPGSQYGYFESIRVKAEPVTETGWTGSTPAGTNNLMGSGQSGGSAGGGAAGSSTAAGPAAGTTSDQGGQSSSGQPDSAHGQAAQSTAAADAAHASPATSPLAGADGVANPPGATVGHTGENEDPNNGGSPAGATVNFAASDPASVAPTTTGSSSIQPAAQGAAQITAGSCKEGAMRCSGATVETCGRVADRIDWVSHSVSCTRGCQELQPGVPSCI